MYDNTHVSTANASMYCTTLLQRLLHDDQLRDDDASQYDDVDLALDDLLLTLATRTLPVAFLSDPFD